MIETPDHFERILVPIDFVPADDDSISEGRSVQVGSQDLEFAPASIRALQLATQLALPHHAELLLVHATPAMHANAMYTGPVAVPAKVLDDIHDRAREVSLDALRLMSSRYCSALNVGYAVRPGVAVNVVLEEAERFKADLIVMAASGRSRVARFFVGSTADRVIRQAHCPVLVIPAVPHDGHADR